MMKLDLAAGAALAGLTYIFAAKTIDTFWHGIFAQPALAVSVVGLNILAGLAQLNFYIQLFRKMAPPDRPGLRLAAWMGIIGAALGILPKLLALAVLYPKPVFFSILRHGSYLATFCPWSGAALLCICCLVFFLDNRPGRDPFLSRAFGAGAAGYFVMASVLSVVLVNYLSGVRTVWSAGQTGTSHLIFIFTASFTYIAVAYFYAGFIRRPKRSFCSREDSV